MSERASRNDGHAASASARSLFRATALACQERPRLAVVHQPRISRVRLATWWAASILSLVGLVAWLASTPYASAFGRWL